MSDIGGLGRGLDALIPGSFSDTEEASNEAKINLIDINPHQPRTVFDEEELAELSKSIKKHGVLQPLIVSKIDNHFELIAGERRLRAAKMAGLATVPVVVRDANDHQKLEMAIIENVHRSDLNPLDESLSYRKLIEDFNYTQEQVAENVGKSRAAIANKLRLLTLSTEMKKALKEGKITEGHAKALLSIDDLARRQAVFESILTDELNVREVERKAKIQSPNNKSQKEIGEHDLVIKQLADDLKAYLGAKVAIRSTKKGGKIEIEYYSAEELARIYQKIKGIE
jgi:ParB family transcriptional regulator, chromosome partitioning protein